jgi:hypothetical protein
VFIGHEENLKSGLQKKKADQKKEKRGQDEDPRDITYWRKKKEGC